MRTIRLYDPEVLFYPARDLIFYQADIHGNLITKQRIQVLKALLERRRSGDHKSWQLYGISDAS